MVGSFTSALLYDRYQKKKAQQRWCHLVSHLKEEPLPVNMMPRKITIVLNAPPGDGLRVAREHFHEYIKPVLVAGAMDWEVIEGRKEGDVRAGLAEKIRKLRKRNGEVSMTEPVEEDAEDLRENVRRQSGCKDWEGVRGDLVLGRHTWKEYVRGLHEGWLGPLDPPQSIEKVPSDQPLLNTVSQPNAFSASLSQEAKAMNDSPPDTAESSPDSTPSQPSTDISSPSSTPEAEKVKEKPSKPTPKPPYILPTEYPSSPISSTVPPQFAPAVSLPLPHLLGFIHTPTRLYRFLTRRHLADTTGAITAALVLASYSRPYQRSTEFASAVDPDDSSPSIVIDEGAVTPTAEEWEQNSILKHEEQEWHKTAWKANEEGDTQERVWQEKMVIDPRIGPRMRTFALEKGAERKANALSKEHDKREDSYWTQVRKWAGWVEQGRKGWEMGLEGGEDD